MDICGEHGGPFRVAGDLVTGDEPQPVIRGEHRRQHHKRGGRQNASDPSSIETRYGNTLRSRLFVQQKASDEESRDDEKDVDTDKSSSKRSVEAVIEQYQPDSNSTHTLNIRAKMLVGTGPSARIISYGGRRRRRRFVALNCVCAGVHVPLDEGKIRDHSSSGADMRLSFRAARL